MGGTVGIEAARLEALDYETVRASGLAFSAAHSALQRSLKKSKSINIADDQTSIHFLAIRQLSHNLKNQKVLEKTRHKVLKTKSVPHNVKYRQHSFEIDGVQEHADGEDGTPLGADGDGAEADLSHDDLDLVHDDEYYQHHHHHQDGAPSVFMDDGPPWNFADHARHDKAAAEETHSATESTTHHPEEAKSSSVEVAAPPAAAPAAKGRKPRPVLSLQLTSNGVSSNALATDVTINNNVGATHPIKLKETHGKSQHGGDPHDSGGAHAQPKGMPPSPSANVRVSPRGTLYMGKWKVMETGIFPDESILNSSRRANNSNNNNGLHPSSSVGAGLGASQGGHLLARAHNSSSNNIHGSVHRLASSTAIAGSVRKQAPLPAIGGKRDFLEINTLGSGASGVVTEAIHLPSLTIVALKMLPVYNQEKRQHVSRELGVLYKNLAELRLVDDSLYQEGKEGAAAEAGAGEGAVVGAGTGGKTGLGGVSSPHILSLYNAFVDPKSGMINLVIEYMDGGSLEDLVQQGGCADEKVLADIAYQTTKGLAFLHANKSVHRDIKPANILWSTSGMIKIGDFGISKALDKTSGFANSFVGTVSYMSPERITGESYGFSCDIWSLGLTLLAVAKGRFPLNTKEAKNAGDSPTESTGSPQQVVGGAAGYWAMIQAICDDEPPRAGPSYSAEFNAFIDACLRKDPAARLSSKQLLATPFIEKNATSLKLSFSDLQARRSVVSGTPAGQHAAVEHHGEEGAGRDAKESAGLAIDTSRAHDLHVVVPPSPLTTRLTNAAIVRRTSQDYPSFESPSSRMRKSLGEADQNGTSSKGEPTSGSVSGDAIPEEEGGGAETESDATRLIEGEIAATDVIIAIRLEHLDRVLERIAHRLRSCQSRLPRTRSDSGEEVEDDGYDDTQDHDLTDIHHFGDEFGEVRDDALLQPHDSVDSMDKLLQYKDVEPSPPPLQLPARKFAPHRAEDVAEAKLSARAEDAPHAKGDRPDKLADRGEKEQQDPLSREEAKDLEDKHHEQHGILKGPPHHAHHVPGHAPEELMKAEDKKAIFAAARGRSSGSSAFNSNRSVHFLEGGSDEHGQSLMHPGAHTHAHTHAHGHVSILGVAEASSADAEEDAGEPVASALAHPVLPKTSSYFVQSRFQRRDGAAKEGDGEDEDSDENDAMAVVDHAIAVSEAVSQAVLEEPTAPLPVDYCRMLPKLNSRGLPKWENLARQLHLPLHLVKLAVRSRLGALLDLEAEDEEVDEEVRDGDELEEGTDENATPEGRAGSPILRREEKEQ